MTPGELLVLQSTNDGGDHGPLPVGSGQHLFAVIRGARGDDGDGPIHRRLYEWKPDSALSAGTFPCSVSLKLYQAQFSMPPAAEAELLFRFFVRVRQVLDGGSDRMRMNSGPMAFWTSRGIWQEGGSWPAARSRQSSTPLVRGLEWERKSGGKSPAHEMLSPL